MRAATFILSRSATGPLTRSHALGLFGRAMVAAPVQLSSARLQARHSASTATQSWECRALPAPGVPFHVAVPVHNLEAAKEFYGGILGCDEGRSSTKWQDYSLHGHQVVCHWVGEGTCRDCRR